MEFLTKRTSIRDRAKWSSRPKYGVHSDPQSARILIK